MDIKEIARRKSLAIAEANSVLKHLENYDEEVFAEQVKAAIPDVKDAARRASEAGDNALVAMTKGDAATAESELGVCMHWAKAAARYSAEAFNPAD